MQHLGARLEFAVLGEPGGGVDVAVGGRLLIRGVHGKLDGAEGSLAVRAVLHGLFGDFVAPELEGEFLRLHLPARQGLGDAYLHLGFGVLFIGEFKRLGGGIQRGGEFAGGCVVGHLHRGYLAGRFHRRHVLGQAVQVFFRDGQFDGLVAVFDLSVFIREPAGHVDVAGIRLFLGGVHREVDLVEGHGAVFVVLLFLGLDALALQGEGELALGQLQAFQHLGGAQLDVRVRVVRVGEDEIRLGVGRHLGAQRAVLRLGNGHCHSHFAAFGRHQGDVLVRQAVGGFLDGQVQLIGIGGFDDVGDVDVAFGSFLRRRVDGEFQGLEGHRACGVVRLGLRFDAAAAQGEGEFPVAQGTAGQHLLGAYGSLRGGVERVLEGEFRIAGIGRRGQRARSGVVRQRHGQGLALIAHHRHVLRQGIQFFHRPGQFLGAGFELAVFVREPGGDVDVAVGSRLLIRGVHGELDGAEGSLAVRAVLHGLSFGDAGAAELEGEFFLLQRPARQGLGDAHIHLGFRVPVVGEFKRLGGGVQRRGKHAGVDVVGHLHLGFPAGGFHRRHVLGQAVQVFFRDGQRQGLFVGNDLALFREPVGHVDVAVGDLRLRGVQGEFQGVKGHLAVCGVGFACLAGDAAAGQGEAELARGQGFAVQVLERFQGDVRFRAVFVGEVQRSAGAGHLGAHGAVLVVRHRDRHGVGLAVIGDAVLDPGVVCADVVAVGDAVVILGYGVRGDVLSDGIRIGNGMRCFFFEFQFVKVRQLVRKGGGEIARLTVFDGGGGHRFGFVVGALDGVGELVGGQGAAFQGLLAAEGGLHLHFLHAVDEGHVGGQFFRVGIPAEIAHFFNGGRVDGGAVSKHSP